MTSPDEWVHIAGHAWDRHSVGCQYTIHEENGCWVARGFSVSAGGAAAIKTEEAAHTLAAAKQIVRRSHE